MSVAAGLVPRLVLARVDPVDMNIRVVAAWVGFVVARVDLAATKAVSRTIEVGPMKT